eukprot:9131918-Pyramimonas_sp.AAC.1
MWMNDQIPAGGQAPLRRARQPRAWKQGRLKDLGGELVDNSCRADAMAERENSMAHSPCRRRSFGAARRLSA